jgi:hypothetical protein
MGPWPNCYIHGQGAFPAVTGATDIRFRKGCLLDDKIFLSLPLVGNQDNSKSPQPSEVWIRCMFGQALKDPSGSVKTTRPHPTLLTLEEVHPRSKKERPIKDLSLIEPPSSDRNASNSWWDHQKLMTRTFKMQILTNSNCLSKYRTYGLVEAIQANENVCSIKLKVRKITVEHPAYSFQNRLFISPTAYQLEREQKCDLCTRNLETSTFWTTRCNHKI